MIPTVISIIVHLAELTLSHPGSLEPAALYIDRKRRNPQIEPLLKALERASLQSICQLTIRQGQKYSSVYTAPCGIQGETSKRALVEK